MKRRTAKSIGEVLNIVGEARDRWKMKDDQELWFRGEDAKHLNSTLQPKLYRHLSADLEVVSKNILSEECYFHSEFARCGTQLYGDSDVDDWDWYFLMQHHGAPTRLLDWSDGALMGLHFALTGDQQNSKGAYVYVVDPFQLSDDIDKLHEMKDVAAAWKAYRQHRKERGKTWPRAWDEVYLPGMHSLSDPGRRSSASDVKKPPKPELPFAPLVLEFPQITRRVAAQRSRFMVYGRDKNWLTRWATKEPSPIWRIFIPRPHLKAIRTQLRDAGVTESVIFPDLDGLGRELNQLWNTVKKRRSLSK